MSDSKSTMVTFTIDGKEFQAPAGTTIIRAAHEAGIDIPFFCYHPGLTPDGNCRMCLVDVAGGRKPVASCVTPVAQGMEVTTNSESVEKARRGVLELMLINHPLDCPICDKSGECLLQDNVYDHGPDNSRMLELKELKPTKDLGPTIALWGNRCISCTRCVRFCDEVSGSGELTIVNRADHSVVDVFDEYPLENPLAMNTVDICPVGALISKEFLYEARVWYLKKQDSICVGCARGCNIEIHSLSNEIKRLMPRHNPHVNDYWMCDEGRADHTYVASEDRLYGYRLVSSAGAAPSSAPGDAVEMLASGLRDVVAKHGPEAIAGLASAFMTLEELHLFRAVFEALGAAAPGALARPGRDRQTFPRFAISGDRNPNRTGVEQILGGEAFDRAATIADGIRTGRIRGLIVVSDLPRAPLDDEWIELLGSLEFAAVLAIARDERLPGSVSVLPATTFAEKDGSMINEDGRIQRLRCAVQPPRSVRREIDLLQEVLVALGAWERVLSADGVFRKLGTRIAELEGKSLRDLGGLGVQLDAVKSAAGARA